MVKIAILAFWIAGIIAAQPVNQFRLEAQIQGQQSIDRVRTTETIVARFTKTVTPTPRATARPGTPTFTPTRTP